MLPKGHPVLFDCPVSHIEAREGTILEPGKLVCVVVDNHGNEWRLSTSNVRVDPDRTFNPERAVLVTADSWEQLRRSDVYRLFDSHEPAQWTPIFRCLKRNRPDLMGEANECLEDLFDESLSSPGGFEFDGPSFGL